jgi:hypothetical protein
MRHIAIADRSDVIRFDALDEIISAAARPAHDDETLLVPGAPEAKSDGAALAALVAFVKAVRPGSRNARHEPARPHAPSRRAQACGRAARDRTDPQLRAGRLGPQRKTRRPRPVERNRLALLSSRRRAIPGRFAASLYHAIGDIEAALCNR